MDVLLTSEIAEYVNEKIESGLYRSANEVILEGLKLLKERDEALRLRHEVLCRDIRIGIDQADSGHVSTFDETILNDVKERGRQRLAASQAAENP